MHAVTIRKATEKDLATLRRFEQGVIETERPLIPRMKKGTVHYYKLEYMLTAPHIHLVVAEQDGVVIGSGYARIDQSEDYLQHPQHAYLGFMYVEPAHRGKGVNKIIMDELLRWSVSQGITEAILDVYYGNDSAIRAYEKAGFSTYLITMRKIIRI